MVALQRICLTLRSRFGYLPSVQVKDARTRPIVRLFGLIVVLHLTHAHSLAANMDVVPFGLPLPEGNGVLWEDPREIHKVVVHLSGSPPTAEKIRLEYWGSHWPQQHLPKNREPGGADVGWMELGNWYKGGWRVADTESKVEGSTVVFTFRPINAKEFQNLKDYKADFRYTLKIRVASDEPLPK